MGSCNSFKFTDILIFIFLVSFSTSYSLLVNRFNKKIETQMSTNKPLSGNGENVHLRGGKCIKRLYKSLTNNGILYSVQDLSLGGDEDVRNGPQIDHLILNFYINS